MISIRSLVLVIGLCAAPSAFADDVPPPPVDCPAGALGRSSHDGEWCAPSECTADADCREHFDRKQRVCREQALCVVEKTVEGWDRRNGGKRTYTRTTASVTCSPGDACVDGQCVSAKRCVPIDEVKPEPTPAPAPTVAPTGAPAPSKKSSCQGGAEGPWLFALVAGVLARRRGRG